MSSMQSSNIAVSSIFYTYLFTDIFRYISHLFFTSVGESIFSGVMYDLNNVSGAVSHNSITQKQKHYKTYTEKLHSPHFARCLQPICCVFWEFQ